MKLKELEKQINDRLGEVENATASQLLDKVEHIVYNILEKYTGVKSDDENRLYITTYNGQIKLTTYGCYRGSAIYIKLRKKLISKTYEMWYGYKLTYKVVKVEVSESDDYDSIEGFLWYYDDLDRKRKEREQREAKKFEKALADVNIDFEKFYGLVEQYKGLSFNSKEILSEKHAGNRYTYF